MACLTGLLLTVGLRLTVDQVVEAIKSCRWSLILFVNFIGIPLLVAMLIRVFDLEAEIAVGMILLAAAPFAPVVPVFVKLIRGDLALAAGLTSSISILSAFVTPLVILFALRIVPGAGALSFDVLEILGILMATITVPMLIGMAIHHLAPDLTRRILRPIEVFSEATGALSLIVVTVGEFESILAIGWVPLLAMSIGSEVSLALGYWLGAGERRGRRVVAFGTSNRNIALALLLAVQNYAGTNVVSAVVANGFLLILFGLLHVAFWRFIRAERDSAPAIPGFGAG
ncbi:MAG: bile acid:sodium symporter [Deltaproteobacteria bacterium]|nr:bile acid:sodium symporter [Deltaproteobacteria bacterium]